MMDSRTRTFERAQPQPDNAGRYECLCVGYKLEIRKKKRNKKKRQPHTRSLCFGVSSRVASRSSLSLSACHDAIDQIVCRVLRPPSRKSRTTRPVAGHFLFPPGRKPAKSCMCHCPLSAPVGADDCTYIPVQQFKSNMHDDSRERKEGRKGMWKGEIYSLEWMRETSSSSADAAVRKKKMETMRGV